MFWRKHLNLNVRVAVNIKFKMATAATATDVVNPLLRSTTTTTTTTTRSDSALKPCGGISTILIINLFVLLLLSLCCDVCKSNDLNMFATAFDATAAAATTSTGSVANARRVIDQIDSNLTVFNDDSDADADAAANENSSDLLHALVTSDCLQRCGEEQGVFLDEFGIKCEVGDAREKCFRARCSKGCEQWLRALKEFEPCQEACSSTQFYPFDLPCISACEMAQRHYWHLQRLAMQVRVSATIPQLLNNSLSANSLTLQWPITFPDNYLASRPFNIQYQYAKAAVAIAKDDLIEMANKKEEESWFNLADYNCNENFDCEILDGLMPYTDYRFRFELPFGDSSDDTIYSPATAVCKTFAMGAPISKPLIINYLAMDYSHVAVFWKPGKFTNGPLKGYKLILQNVNQNSTLEKLLPSHIEHYIFDDLMSVTNYTLQIAMFNIEGDGPFDEISLVTPESAKPTNRLMEDFNDILLVGEYHIKLKSLEPLTETKLLYQSETLLSDYALYMHSQRLFVIDVDGYMFSLFLNNTAEIIPVKLDFESLKPTKISVDWLNQRLFIAGETTDNLWAIITSDLAGKTLNVLTTTLNKPIEQLEVDPINGWLFWTQYSGALTRLNLETLNVEIVMPTNSTIGYFTNDYKRFLLIAYNKTDNELYELSYDGIYTRKLNQAITTISNSITSNIMRTLQGEWQSFQHFNDAGTILATNGTHLMRQNYHTNEHDIWVIRDLEWCWSVLPLQQQHQLLQPLPQPYARPAALQVRLTSNMAKISWLATSHSHIGYDYQTGYAWKQWEYELEIMDVASNSAFNIRNIKTTYFNVEKLQANNLYKLRVRATAPPSPASSRTVAAALVGEWSEELLTRTWPRGEHKFLWASAIDRGWLYETNEQGANALRLGELDNVGIRDFVQLNGTVYYITGDEERRLQCANIMNPEVNCSFTAAGAAVTNAVSLGYDWRGGRLYWTDRRRNCLVRANLSGGERELLPIFDAQHIKIDSFNGFIYYSTGQRLARRTLSGANLGTDELEYFHVNGFGGQIRGFALDDAQQQIYWVVRQSEGHVRMFRASTEQRNIHKFTEDRLLEHDIELHTLQYLSVVESLIWVQLNSSKSVLLRTDAFSDRHAGAVIKLDEWPRVASVKLKHDYTPFVDQSVIPETVDVASIYIDDGYWDDFNIRWTAINAADNYTVIYKVLLQYGGSGGGGEPKKLRFYTLEVTEPFVRITEFHQPLLLLNVSITAHTYWRAGATVHAQLRTPNAAPTQPRRLRIFVQRHDEAMQTTPNISALIRWDPPENVSIGAEIAYKVYCWHGENLFAERLHNFSSESALEAVVDELLAGETYTFQVQAFVAGRSSGGEKTTFHALHINPDVQSVPRLLYATSDVIAQLDMDLASRKVLVHTASEVEHLFVLQGEQRLLWVNENVELMSFVPGAAAVKLARMRAEVHALTVDWIMRVVYWAEMDTDVEHAVSIYNLNLCQFEGRVMLGNKLWTSAPGRAIKDLIVLPFAQTLLWLESEWGVSSLSNATLMGRNLTDLSVLKFKGATTALARMFEGSLTAELETVNLVDYKGKICAYDVHRHMCNPLKMHFNVVTDVIADINRDAGYIYALKNDSIRVYNRRKQNLEYMLDVADVRKIRAYNYQQYPARQCLLPESEAVLRVSNQLEPHVTTLAENYIILALPAVNTNKECNLNVPGLKYQLMVYDSQNNTRNFTSFEAALNITQLAPFTNYSIQMRISSYYQQKLGLPLLEPQIFEIRTAAGTPTAPQNFSAYVLSPTEIHISWLDPLIWNCDKIWYQLHWQKDNSTLSAFKTLELNSLILNGLEPAQKYILWLQVFSTEHKFNTTARVEVKTFERPSPLHLLRQSAYNLTLGWPTTANLANIMLVFRALNADGSGGDTVNSIDITHNASHVIVADLAPKTKYEFYLALTYAAVTRPYLWPEAHHERFVFETLGDSPSSPGQPQIEHIAGEIFKIYWDPARDNGAAIVEYSLEALQARLPANMKRKRRDVTLTPTPTTMSTSSMERVYMTANKTIALLSQLPWVEELQPIEDKWLMVCNTSTSELSCIVREMYTLRLSVFRVRARNKPYGWGPYSAESERVFEPFVSPEKRNSLVMAIIAPAAIVSSCVILLVLVRMVQNRRLKAKKLLEKSRPSIWSNFSTLQQQQQLMASRNRAFSVASHSTMYTGGPLSDADIALLPHISWNQITLLSFLGSGAFGEVYEGLVKYEDEQELEKVAIKSLRKGASEFSELLQEAQLMSNFRHENIVRLIGVCFDAESISIIMEHMEGGDLLTYLRESRPNSNKPIASLQLIDLMTMCIDVATGCSYLEDMHFVHRDLACRNCLVSSRVPSRRVVKIGDFGLARDIYKNDYYRKEGEGLLPVRWMSPESLVDGVFTMQSDVWAFGVLCWEILSLGQQPYAARNNFDVLNFVKDGGRLEQPDNCPDKLFTLMLQCWHEDPEERPSFRKCLNALLSIKTDVRRVSLGYNMDDPDFPMYANHNGIVLSSFLANPLSKVDEEDDILEECALSVESFNDKSDLKVRFECSPISDELVEAGVKALSDKEQLIEEKTDDEKASSSQCYDNEGVSRL